MAFPASPLDVTVSVFYNSTWNDITDYVLQRDAAPIVITRGRGNERGRCSPGRMSLQLNNVDGRFTPDNPASPLFGKITQNTRIRVQVTYNAVTYTRFVGEVTSWPNRWDVTGSDVWVQLEASGILRRIGRPSRPQKSSLYRAMVGAASGDVVPAEYWPFEDGENASRYASAVGGRHGIGRLDTSGTALPSPSGHDGIPGSSASVLLPPGSAIDLPVRPYTDTGQWAIQAAEIADAANVDLFVMAELAGGGRVEANIENGLSSDLALSIFVYDAAGTPGYSDSVDLSGQTLVGQPLSLMFADTDTGGGDDFVARVYDGFGTIRGQLTTTNIGYDTVRSILVLNDWDPAEDTAGVSHVALFTDPTFDVDVDPVEGARAISGWLAGPADERFEHLCAQAKISSTVIGGSQAYMGRERSTTRMQALRDCEDADQGMIFETRDDLGLTLRTNSSRFSQVPVKLDYDSGHIYPPFLPEPDDLGVFNDREVSRYNGSSARAVLESGTMSIQDPPDGVGESADSITVNTYTDDQLDHLAWWRLHIGTWRAARYPQVRINLAGSPSLIPTVVPLDSGDRMTISNLPDWLPPGGADLLIEGYGEGIGEFSWNLIFNASPAGAYDVVGRWALLSHELHAAVNSSVTSIDVANTDVNQPMLATAVSDIGTGYGLTISTEDLQLSSVAASSVTFGATGTAAHANNANVTPGIPASVATGNLLLCVAAIRNSGTGVPNTPAGYTRLAVFPSTANVQVFAKIATSGAEVAPTISFTGGVANADTSAQMIRLAGKWHSVANILVGSATRLNPSAQDIIVPGLPKPVCDDCIVLGVGWKQDDWTSVATRSGFTEIGEPSTTTGDDQGFVWDRVIQTTATSIPATPFVATGGASAISRSAIFALRCDYQTATVTRSTNGVSASHSAGDAVTMTKPMRWGLV